MGYVKKKEINKTIAERTPDTEWFFAIWPIKKYVVAWYKHTYPVVTGLP